MLQHDMDARQEQFNVVMLCYVMLITSQNQVEAREQQCHHSGKGQQAAGHGQWAAKQVRDVRQYVF
jgi:hypothetical protein